MAEVSWETYLLRSFFVIVVVCHIPFIFFVGKECFLTILDEFMRKSISKSLNASLLSRSNNEHTEDFKDVMSFKSMP